MVSLLDRLLPFWQIANTCRLDLGHAAGFHLRSRGALPILLLVMWLLIELVQLIAS